MVAQLIKTKKTAVFIRKIWQNCVESVAIWLEKKYEVKKYTDKIENKFYINVNIDNNAIHSEYMCQKYYLAMTSSTKRKTTIKLKPLMNGTHTALTAKLKMKLLQKGLIGTQ